MRVVVCVRQGLDGELSPFDACAYEEALRIEGAEITLLSMGPPRTGELLLKLTRLGAARAILLSDAAFAGADTLATAYTLARAIERISPDLVLCGRQTLVGDTAQTGAMLSVFAGMALVTNVMRIDRIDAAGVLCQTRSEGDVSVPLPALLTVERINTLRLPRLRSKQGELIVWGAQDVGADKERCGLCGSPTRVVATFENQSGKRRCKFIRKEQLADVVAAALAKNGSPADASSCAYHERLADACIIGSAPRAFAEQIAERVTELPLADACTLAEQILSLSPTVVLWGSDTRSKRLAATVAAKLGLGLCADCTRLAYEDGEVMMYRPALSGSVLAKIKSLTRPAMATVRGESGSRDVVVTAGYGVKDSLDAVRRLAETFGAELCATRRLVDDGYAGYEMQVGLTGKTVSPPVYIAVGVSGAVHHVAGMQRSGTVIAINPDKDAPIFEYADYGIVDGL